MSVALFAIIVYPYGLCQLYWSAGAVAVGREKFNLIPFLFYHKLPFPLQQRIYVVTKRPLSMLG